VKFLFDENIDPATVRGLLREDASLDVVQARLEHGGTSDEFLIEWSTKQNCLLVTRDVNTLVGFAYKRVEEGVPTCGIIVLRQEASLRSIIQDLLLLAKASEADEWVNQVIYLPLK
jgi:predicted nuclease of predicted toxin-antitoxin system